MPIIYKLACKTMYVLDWYVGRTVDLPNRISNHKYMSLKSDRLLYKTIRKHGGWENWYVVPIEECCDFEAKERELYYVNLLKPSLNMNKPLRDVAQWKIDNRLRYNDYMREYMRTYKSRKPTAFPHPSL